MKKSSSDNAINPPPKNLGSLLRLFKSCFFDTWLAVTYLYKYENQGVQDYLCNELYGIPDEIFEMYLPQLCHLLIHRDSPALERLLFDRCAKSMHIAIQTFWFFHASVEDFPTAPNGENRCVILRQKCETSAVNGYWSQPPIFRTPEPTPPTSPTKLLAVPNNSLSSSTSVPANLESLRSKSEGDDMKDEVLVEADSDEDVPKAPPNQEDAPKNPVPESPLQNPSNFTEEELLSETRSIIIDGKENVLSPRPRASTDPVPEISVTAPTAQQIAEEEARLFMAKQMRFDYFTSEVNFFRSLANIGFRLRSVPPADNRTAHLRQELDRLNMQLPSGVYLPVCKADAPYSRILRIPVEEAVCLNSREKVPFLIYLEVLQTHQRCSEPNLFEFAMDISPEELDAKKEWLASRKLSLPQPVPTPQEAKLVVPQPVVVGGGRASPGPGAGASGSRTSPAPPELTSTPLSQFANDATRLGADLNKPEDMMILQAMLKNMRKDAEKEKQLVGFKFEHQDKVFSETYADKMERMRRTSPYGHLPNWKIVSVIVKSGDDCRQEQLALHLIEQFDTIFKEAKLPLWLRPYSCVVMSSHAALIETVPNAPSITTLKKQTPDFTTLANYFRKTYGDDSSMSFKLAQRNFVESMAGYSVVTYLLQIKDRHNGNILLDQEGHIVHIDFGFMLSNSPGSINFETAPFKLTTELVEVMGGDGSDAYNYFKYLCVRGYLEVRKHHEKILLLVDMMRKGSKLACFATGKASIDNLRDRFNINLTEQQAVDHMMQLIDESMNNWRTRQYDNFQRLTNGIL